MTYTPDGIRSEWAAEAEISFGAGLTSAQLTQQNIRIHRDLIARDTARLATADDTADLLAGVGIKLAALIDALELQAEILAPVALFTVAQLDAGRSVPVARG